jgi:hypothetical protein
VKNSKCPSKYLGHFIGKIGIISKNIPGIPTTSVSWPLNVSYTEPTVDKKKKLFRILLSGKYSGDTAVDYNTYERFN